jgi:hypothetical protein
MKAATVVGFQRRTIHIKQGLCQQPGPGQIAANSRKHGTSSGSPVFTQGVHAPMTCMCGAIQRVNLFLMCFFV